MNRNTKRYHTNVNIHLNESESKQNCENQLRINNDKHPTLKLQPSNISMKQTLKSDYFLLNNKPLIVQSKISIIKSSANDSLRLPHKPNIYQSLHQERNPKKQEARIISFLNQNQQSPNAFTNGTQFHFFSTKKFSRPRTRSSQNQLKSNDQSKKTLQTDKSEQLEKSIIINSPRVEENKSIQLNLNTLKISTKSQVGRKPNKFQLNEKRHNQDYLMTPSQQNLDYRIFGVCDGHGAYGHNVAQIVGEYLPKSISSQIQKNQFVLLCDTNFHEVVLRNAFMETEKFLNSTIVNTNLSGCTANVVLFAQQLKQEKNKPAIFQNTIQKNRETVIYCAHVGDSRTIVASYSENNNINVIELSQDHRADDPNERIRINNRGGKVEHFRDFKGLSVGPARVWSPMLSSPGLAMSRSFGDKVAHSLGVITEPTIKQYKIMKNDLFMVIASDGIFQYMSNQEVGDLVYKSFKDGKFDDAATNLTEAANQKWLNVRFFKIQNDLQNDNVVDDISCIVIFFQTSEISAE